MRVLALLPILALALAGCGPPPADHANSELRRVTEANALEAISDIHAMSLQALFELIAGGGLTEGRLTVSMDEEANLATGTGRFRITLSHYALPTDSPLATDYNGYVVTGVIEIDSRGYDGTFGAVDVTLRHANPRQYPVERIEALVLEQPPPAAQAIPERSKDPATAGEPANRGGVAGSAVPRGGVAGVRLFVNGRRMPGRLLLGGGK